jgi:hypothetical protein
MNVRVEEPALKRTLRREIRVLFCCDRYGVHVGFRESEKAEQLEMVVPVTPDVGREWTTTAHSVVKNGRSVSCRCGSIRRT